MPVSPLFLFETWTLNNWHILKIPSGSQSENLDTVFGDCSTTVLLIVSVSTSEFDIVSVSFRVTLERFSISYNTPFCLFYGANKNFAMKWQSG